MKDTFNASANSPWLIYSNSFHRSCLWRENIRISSHCEVSGESAHATWHETVDSVDSHAAMTLGSPSIQKPGLGWKIMEILIEILQSSWQIVDAAFAITPAFLHSNPCVHITASSRWSIHDPDEASSFQNLHLSESVTNTFWPCCRSPSVLGLPRKKIIGCQEHGITRLLQMHSMSKAHSWALHLALLVNSRESSQALWHLPTIAINVTCFELVKITLPISLNLSKHKNEWHLGPAKGTSTNVLYSVAIFLGF